MAGRRAALPTSVIETDFLPSWMPGLPRTNIVDRHSTDSDYWLADPGPSVDSRKFMVDGPWDGVTNLLLQIFAGQLSSPWVHGRLQLVDTDSKPERVARLAGAAFVLRSAGARARLATIEASEVPTTA